MGVGPGGAMGGVAALARSTGGTTVTVVVTSVVMAGMNTVVVAVAVAVVVTVEVMVAATVVGAVVVVTVEVMGAATVVAAAAVTVVGGGVEVVVAGMTGMMMDQGAGMVAARHGVEGAPRQGRTARSAGPRLSSGTVSERRSDEPRVVEPTSVIYHFIMCR